MDRKALIIAGLLIFGIPLLAVAGCAATWKLSPIFRERAYEAALASKICPVQTYAARKLREYPSRAAAISLMVSINLAGKTGSGCEEFAQTALASLILLSGENFGTDFEGGEYNYSWSPPNAESWPAVTGKVNDWAMTALGPDAFAALAVSLPGLPKPEITPITSDTAAPPSPEAAEAATTEAAPSDQVGDSAAAEEAGPAAGDSAPGDQASPSSGDSAENPQPESGETAADPSREQ